MRLFAAIELDDAVRQAIQREQRRLERIASEGRSALRWVGPDQLHLTLAFLGEVPESRATMASQALCRPLHESCFEMGFGGLGLFPPLGAPRVLWLGVTRGSLEVIDTQREVMKRLEGAGVSLEQRVFHPHLTLARWRRSRPSDRSRLLAAARPDEVAVMKVEAVTLFESRLSAAGAAHMALCHARLGERASSPLQS